MKKFLKTALLLMMVLITIFSLVGCTEAQRVSRNVSQQADNFNVQRRVTVINTRTDKPVLEVIGNLSVQNTGDGDVDLIIETSPNVFMKHFVHLNEWTIYVVEDISGAYVDKYHYEINFLPEMIIPITFTSQD